MTKRDLNEDEFLELYFSAERAQGPEPSGDLMARIMADADATLATRPSPATKRARPRRNLFVAFAAAIGGWPAFASMATAAVAGVWIGVSAPNVLAHMTGGLIQSAESYAIEDLAPGYGALATLEAGDLE
ncbi:dihydroorotate dehydrogenase [uncultured Maritimibacter sp.]|jgi:hypothetical protein|uniref:dihydroorotate dehydrogenase n=1 Tax=uncultured Maritimibacter sp. TaxID=991866 RepID=UPI00263018A8|nr:dihydroorotate dehydrogenase [uncultured Maritimibacter sp.]